ncbi:hypothetical protein ACVBEF_15945 [Glaciimonas sp. GG7]
MTTISKLRLNASLAALLTIAFLLSLGLSLLNPLSAFAAPPLSASTPLTDNEKALHVLNRLAYGPVLTWRVLALHSYQ